MVFVDGFDHPILLWHDIGNTSTNAAGVKRRDRHEIREIGLTHLVFDAYAETEDRLGIKFNATRGLK